MKNFVKPGKNINFISDGTVKAGEPVVAGAFVGIAANDSLDDEVNVMSVEGVYDMLKTAGEAYTQGQALYLIVATKLLTSTAGTNKFVGYAESAALAGSLSVPVYLARPGA